MTPAELRAACRERALEPAPCPCTRCAVASARMQIVCPYCGETIAVFIDEGGGPHQRYVEDCSVCCRPIELSVEEDADGGLRIAAMRADE